LKTRPKENHIKTPHLPHINQFKNYQQAIQGYLTSLNQLIVEFQVEKYIKMRVLVFSILILAALVAAEDSDCPDRDGFQGCRVRSVKYESVIFIGFWLWMLLSGFITNYIKNL
jgi:hypothetical protein